MSFLGSGFEVVHFSGKKAEDRRGIGMVVVSKPVVV